MARRDEAAAYPEGSHEELFPPVPELFTSKRLLRDELQTETSLTQDITVQECLPHLAYPGIADAEYGSHGLPRLKRQLHIRYLHNLLKEKSNFHIAYDSSRPWLVYWALMGLCLLGEDVAPYKERYARIAWV